MFLSVPTASRFGVRTAVGSIAEETAAGWKISRRSDSEHQPLFGQRCRGLEMGVPSRERALTWTERGVTRRGGGALLSVVEPHRGFRWRLLEDRHLTRKIIVPMGHGQVVSVRRQRPAISEVKLATGDLQCRLDDEF